MCFFALESDFININLCAENILKDVKKTIVNKLPSLKQVKLAMEEILIYGREFVVSVSQISFVFLVLLSLLHKTNLLNIRLNPYT